MAQPATPNHTNNYNFNVVFHFRETHHTPAAAARFFLYNFPSQSHDQSDQHHMIQMSSRQAIYAFIVTVLLNLVQIKYQGKLESPFETRPKTIFLSIATLLLYHCFSYYVKIRSRTTPVSAAYLDYISKISLGFCGPMSLACVTSLLLPQSLSPLAFSLSLLFSFSQLLLPSHVLPSWDSLTTAAIFIVRKFRGQPPLRRTRGGGGVQVQLPWLPQPTNGVQILPL